MGGHHSRFLHKETQQVCMATMFHLKHSLPSTSVIVHGELGLGGMYFCTLFVSGGFNVVSKRLNIAGGSCINLKSDFMSLIHSAGD